MAETFGDRPVGGTVQPCPLAPAPAPAEPPAWIAIALVGEDDRPIAWQEYRVTLPNGDEVRGYLDGEGAARIENIRPPGTCRVTFPGLDGSAWQFVASR